LAEFENEEVIRFDDFKERVEGWLREAGGRWEQN